MNQRLIDDDIVFSFVFVIGGCSSSFQMPIFMAISYIQKCFQADIHMNTRPVCFSLKYLEKCLVEKLYWQMTQLISEKDIESKKTMTDIQTRHNK